MNQRLTTVFSLLAVLLCLTGCMSKVRYPSLYTLNLPPAPDPPPPDGFRSSLAIREFRSPVYLRQGPIVYRSSPEQIGFYDYQRWGVDPRESVTNAVADRLRASNNFAQVKIYDGHYDVDYILSGRLEKLEELDYQGGVKVEVAISAQIVRLSTGAQVWSNTVSEIGPVDHHSVPAVVAEMNRTMDRALDKLLSTLPASLPAKGK